MRRGGMEMVAWCQIMRCSSIGRVGNWGKSEVGDCRVAIAISGITLSLR